MTRARERDPAASHRQHSYRIAYHPDFFLSLSSPLYFPLHFSDRRLACGTKFDRSGRSEGVAWVTYASEKHAAAAKEAFDGALAKGESLLWCE